MAGTQEGREGQRQWMDLCCQHADWCENYCPDAFFHNRHLGNFCPCEYEGLADGLADLRETEDDLGQYDAARQEIESIMAKFLEKATTKTEESLVLAVSKDILMRIILEHTYAVHTVRAARMHHPDARMHQNAPPDGRFWDCPAIEHWHTFQEAHVMFLVPKFLQEHNVYFAQFAGHLDWHLRHVCGSFQPLRSGDRTTHDRRMDYTLQVSAGHISRWSGPTNDLYTETVNGYRGLLNITHASKLFLELLSTAILSAPVASTSAILSAPVASFFDSVPSTMLSMWRAGEVEVLVDQLLLEYRQQLLTLLEHALEVDARPNTDQGEWGDHIVTCLKTSEHFNICDIEYSEKCRFL